MRLVLYFLMSSKRGGRRVSEIFEIYDTKANRYERRWHQWCWRWEINLWAEFHNFSFLPEIAIVMFL